MTDLLLFQYDDDLLDGYLVKRVPDKADMMMRFGRARQDVDKMIRFG
jgi:hypothetical protein